MPLFCNIDEVDRISECHQHQLHKRQNTHRPRDKQTSCNPPPFLTVSYYLYIQKLFSTNDANVAPHIGFNLSFFVKLFGGWVWLKF